jgi:hypothetical protein
MTRETMMGREDDGEDGSTLMQLLSDLLVALRDWNDGHHAAAVSSYAASSFLLSSTGLRSVNADDDETDVVFDGDYENDDDDIGHPCIRLERR